MANSDQVVRSQRGDFDGRRISASATGAGLHATKLVPTKKLDDLDEKGAVLILSLAFLVMVSVIVLALASWTFNNLDNTLQFQSVGSRLYAAEGATQVALRASRYTYPPNTSPAGYACPGETTPVTSVNGLYVLDWCSTVIPPVNLGSSTISRQVTLTACQMPSANATLSAQCTGSEVLLTALVNFDDYNSLNLNTGCTSVVNDSNCGTGMTIVSWLPGT